MAYKHMVELRKEHIMKLEKTDPELAEKLKNCMRWMIMNCKGNLCI